jgi:glycosyltransferase domain-containing protein
MLTAVLHTQNRPDFVYRAIKYYSDKFAHRLIVSDASTERNFEELKRKLSTIDIGFPIEIVHNDAKTPFFKRLAEALERVSTPYLLLMADDDFYFQSWPQTAIDYLDRNPECGVVYGHTMHFEIDGYAASGNAKNFCWSVPNPVARWMEHDSAVERLAELGKGPWTTMGWYAVQRAEIFRKFLSQTMTAGFDLDNGERFLNIVQPIYGKLVMLDTIYLARQTNPTSRAPSPHHGPALSTLERVATEALVEASALGTREAQAVVRQTMRAEIAQLRKNELRAKVKVDALKKWVPFLKVVTRAVKGFLNERAGVEPLAPDPRFPASPPLAAARDEIRIVQNACSIV